MKDVLEDPNLAARGYWTYLDHPELKAAIPYPRQFVTSSENDTDTRIRAPIAGEHNAEVYGGIGISARDMAALKEAGVI